MTAPNPFPDLTTDTAPPAARRALAATEQHLGYLPVAMARMANSPELADGFLRVNTAFEGCTLSPLAREVVVFAVATRNRCHLCVAMHTGRLTGDGADPALIAALRAGGPLPDDDLEAVRRFTVAVLDNAGDVADGPLADLLAHGYTLRNALEVVLGVGTYTMSTLANRMTQAPVDDRLAPFAWEPAA